MDKIRIGVIGCGWWATVNYLPILSSREDVKIVSVCGLDENVLRDVQTRFEIPHATTNYRELLDQPLDGIFVVSPHRFHFEHGVAALERGLHVLCEKPLALQATEAAHMVQLAEANQRILLVPYGWNYTPFLQTAKEWMEEGLLGAVEYVLCHMASPTKAFFSGNGSVPSSFRPTVVAPDLSTWQKAAFGGGYAHGQLTHSIALLFWLTGLEAEEVTCRMTQPNSDVDMYDAAVVRFKGGALATISGAATLPDDSKFQLDLRIFGSGGVLLLDVERERLELRLHNGDVRSLPVPEQEGDYRCERPPNAFIDLIRGHGRNYSPGWAAARTVSLIHAMHRSSAGGARVRV